MAGSKTGRGTALALLLALVVGLPFVTKPFHIDDPVVLAVSRQILRDPWRPFAGHLNWGQEAQPLFETTTNPPLVSYYLAPFLARFGAHEVPLHAAMLPFLVVLALATISLGRRFAGGWVWPLLLVMLSPAVVVSGNLMRDVPVAALSAAALAIFVSGVDRRHWALLLAGSLLAGLAMLTKYSAAILVVPALAYLALRREGRLWWSLLPAAGVLGTWCVQNFVTTRQVHLAVLWAIQGNPGSWLDRFWPLWPALGTMLTVAPALLAVLIARRGWWALLAACAAGAAAPIAAARYYHEPAGWQYALWSGMGAALLVAVLAGGGEDTAPRPTPGAPAAERGDHLFLAVWALSVLAFAVFCVPFQAMRHVLPAVVPLALLAGQMARGMGVWGGGLLALLVLVQAALAFAAGAADSEYARSYRDFALRAARRYHGRQVWFAGHWGWQEYASAAGFHLLSRDDPPPPAGSLVILPDRVHQGELPPGLEPLLRPLGARTYQARLPLRTMDGFRQAGFYSLGRLRVPVLLTRDPVLETFRVFQVAEAP